MSHSRLGEWAKRTSVAGQIIMAIGSSAQAPPPTQLPQELAKQYVAHTKIRLVRHRDEVKRLNGTTRQPAAALDKRDAKRLRAKS